MKGLIVMEDHLVIYTLNSAAGAPLQDLYISVTGQMLQIHA